LAVVEAVRAASTLAVAIRYPDRGTV